MVKTVAEIVIAAALTGITLYLVRQRAGVRPRLRSFDLVVLGLFLVTLASWLDALEVQDMAWVPAGVREAEVLVELVLGYLTGIVLVGVGLILWVPAVIRHQHETAARVEAESALAGSQQELESRNETLQILNDLAARLHRTLNVEMAARDTVEALLRYSHPPLVAVYMLEPDGRRLRLVADHGFSEELRVLGATLPVTGSLSGRALREGRLLLSDEVAGDIRAVDTVRSALGEAGIHTAVVIPLIDHDTPLGCLNLVYTERRAFDDSDLETLRGVGRTVSLAMANARHVADLEHQAFHDPLTGLPNRARLHRDFADAQESAGAAGRLALVLLDLDRFQEVNEALGHLVGDGLLQSVSERLPDALAGARATVYRLGGDELAVLLPGVRDVDEAEDVARRALTAVRQPHEVSGTRLVVGASLGIALSPDHGRDASELLRCADVAMYHAKRTAAGITVYSAELDRHTPERLALMTELSRAVREGELVIHFQPKFDLDDGHIVGFEALTRWRHPRRGLLLPSEFIPLAEASDVIHPLTDWVATRAAEQLHRWSGWNGALTMAVNLSPRNLADRSCAGRLGAIIQQAGVPPERIELELTETALMNDPDAAAAALDQISATGVRLAVDDFGVGYSSLAYLGRFPVHSLKIATTFVHDMLRDDRNLAIVRSTIDLAHSLGLSVVAEGVEDGATGEALRAMGCDQAQGFFFCRPGPAETIERLIDSVRA